MDPSSRPQPKPPDVPGPDARTLGRGPRAFAALARLALRFRYLLLAAMLANTAFMAQRIGTRLLVDNSNEAFLDSESDAAVHLEQLRDAFGRDEVFLVLVEGEVFSLPYLARLKALHAALAAIDIPVRSLGERKADRDRRRRLAREGKADIEALAAQQRQAEFGDFGEGDDGEDGWGQDEGGGTVIDDVQSLINARDTRSAAGGLSVTGLLDTWPTEAELPALRARALGNRSIVNQVVGPAANHSALIIRTAFMSEQDSARVYREIERITRAHDSDGFHILVAGMPALLASLNELMTDDMRFMAGLESLVLLLLMAIVFRHPLGLIGPVLVVTQASVWTLGSMAVLSVPMTIVTSVLSAFLQVVGIGDSVHVLSVYRDARARGVENREAIVYAMSSTGMPILYTTLTTAVGLLSFRLAGLQAIRDMGTFGALGVVYALLLSVIALPVLLSFNHRSLLGAQAPTAQAARRTDRLDTFLAWCDGCSRGGARMRRTLLAGALFGACAVGGTALLTFHHDPLTMFPEAHPTRLASDTLSAHMGGSSDLTFVIDTHPGKDLRDRELMLALDALEKHIFAYEDPGGRPDVVGSAASVLDVVRESWRALHGDDPAQYRIPDTERGVSDMFTMFESASPEQLRRLATIDMKKAMMTFRLQWMAAEEYEPLAVHVLQGIEDIVGDIADVRLTGTAYTSFLVVDRLLEDLVTSFGTALFVITLMMVALLRDVKLGLISMLPNLLPIGAVTAFMGFSHIPVDLNNLLFGSVAMGIAVDDTIHFLHQFKVHHARHGDTDAAIAHSFAHAGRAMVSTSILLVGGFLVMLTGTLNSSHMFAILVSLSVVFALLADLLLAPALLRLFYPQVSDARAAEQPAL